MGMAWNQSNRIISTKSLLPMPLRGHTCNFVAYENFPTSRLLSPTPPTTIHSPGYIDKDAFAEILLQRLLNAMKQTKRSPKMRTVYLFLVAPVNENHMIDYV